MAGNTIRFDSAEPGDRVLQPGEYAVGEAPLRMRTLLGSCVSITLWHPVRRVGAMSHFLLAARSPSQQGVPDARYGEEALALMLRQLHKRGIVPAECEAKIFGGGNMFPEQSAAVVPNIGRRNGEAARDLLMAHGIRVHSESLFGNGHRQMIFDLATGDVWVRQVNPESAPMPLEGSGS
jgi:chemotaxis protein CheD